MTILRYDRGELLTDGLRGLAGLVVTLGPILFLDNILLPVAIVLGLAALLFGFFLIRIFLRHKTTIELSQDAIAVVSPVRTRRLAWDQVTAVRLSYFASSRFRAGTGVTTLKLSGGDGDITVESSLSGFDELLAAAARVSARSGVAVDPATVHNFEALGIPIAWERDDGDNGERGSGKLGDRGTI